MASALLNCLLPFFSQPQYVSPQEVAQLPPDQFLNRTMECASSVVHNQEITGQLLPQRMQGDPRQLIQQAFTAASQACVLDRDRDIIEYLRICVQTAMANQGQQQHPYQPPVQQPPVQYQPPQPQHHPGSYASAVGGNGIPMQPIQHQPPPMQQQPVKSDVYAKAFFFPSEQNFKQLTEFIDSAQQTLDCCVFTITDDTVSNALIRAKQRGVTVRIISDDEQAQARGSDVFRLKEENGIPYKLDNSPAHMHHKFAVADRKRLLTGSYNWTKGARFDNRENFLVTNHQALVQEFSTEFDRLWNEFK
ncbi:uncharacterized protein VTP21DRAFT_8526 [Calcarisporiella thermophila]|uniref:uncharacterized protein n=1 Tax=Calcarisporiella thermophila TaxID=911321 RepID=UPI003743966D